jgi:hypothetical protein
MRIKEVRLYEYDELNSKAQEKARDWYRELRDASDFESVIEDADRMAAILGIEISDRRVQTLGGKTRNEPAIWWSLGYVQGDGAAFDGFYRYAEAAPKKIREEAPEDTTLHAIADTLADIQSRYQNGVTAVIKSDSRYWSQNIDVEIDNDAEALDVSTEDYTALRSVFRDFGKWIYTQLRTEDEYRNADEQVADDIRANEYEFTASGRRED